MEFFKLLDEKIERVSGWIGIWFGVMYVPLKATWEYFTIIFVVDDEIILSRSAPKVIEKYIIESV